MKEKIKNFLKNEDGATAVEYALMVALIAAVVITAVTLIGTESSDTFTYVGNEIGNAS